LKIIGEDVVYDGRFISVKKIYFEGRDGKPAAWESVQRKTFGKIVAICALTKNREVILEKSFRIPINSYVIELPAGLMDKKGELPEETIERELLEETGYRVENIELMLEGPFNAGLVADELTIFFGDNAEKVCEPQLESAEDIEVITVPTENLFHFLKNPPDGCKVDIKIFNIIPFLQEKGIL